MSELSGTNLDLVFILIGLAVWARLIVYYASRRPYLRIEPRPDPAGIAFGPEAVLGVLLVFLFVVQVIHTVLEMARGTASDLELSNQVLADILGKTVAIGVMIGIFYSGWYQREILFPTPPVHKKTVLGLSLLIYFAIYPLVNVLLLSLGITFFRRVFHYTGPDIHEAFTRLEDPTTPAALKANLILLAALISPVAEELFFRGLIQNLLLRVFRRAWPAIILTGLLFALIHIPLYPHMPALWMLGIILGWSYYRYRTLAAPILIHLWFNAASLILWWTGGVE